MKQLRSQFETGAAAPERQQLVSIQYLRAIAALTVLITHSLHWPLGGGQGVLVNTGRLGVEIFFVLSGFIITVIGGRGTFDPLAFARNRVLRIVPMYWLATAMVVALALALPSNFRTTVPTLEGVIKSLLFIPSDMPKAPLLLLGWTLNFEAFLYLVFGSLFFVNAAKRSTIVAALFIALMALGLAIEQPTHVQAFYTSLSLLGFLVGVGVGRLYQLGWLQRIGGTGTTVLMIAGTLALSVFYLMSVMFNSDSNLIPFHASMSFGAMAIVVVAIRMEIDGRLPAIPALRFLGDASYSLYLFHIFAVAAVWAVGQKLFGSLNLASYLLLSSASIFAGLAAGVIAYWYLERPMLNWTRQRRRADVATPRSTASKSIADKSVPPAAQERAL